MLKTWHRTAHVCVGALALVACASQPAWDGPTGNLDAPEPEGRAERGGDPTAVDPAHDEALPPVVNPPVRDALNASAAPVAAAGTTTRDPGPDAGAGEDPWWAKRNREDGGCGDRLYYTAPWALEFDFPELGVQANWQVDRASDAGMGTRQSQGTYEYRGAELDDLAARCRLGKGCTGGGSRLRLRSATGELVLHVHLTPGELPPMAEGSQVVLDTGSSGELTLSDPAGALLIGIVRAGTTSSSSQRSYALGDFAVRKGPAVCFATQEMCNYRLTVHELVVQRGAQSWQLAPGRRVTAQMDGASYQLENHFAAQQGIALADKQTCAAGRPEFDSISIVRRP